MTKNALDYKKHLASLLANYVDGSKVFIKNDWDEPVRLKPGARGDNLSENWMLLIERVTGIIAQEKYGLTTYPTEIQLLSAPQMIDTYVNVGMPYNYDHWSFAVERNRLSRQRTVGMNLAYELVINSNPSICYCMTSNSKTMQALVISHAAQGHNAFFKNNTMFKQFTNADEILNDLKRLRDFAATCETQYGTVAVERILDACHALELHAVDHAITPKSYLSENQRKMRKAAIELAREQTYDTVIEETSFRKKPASTFRSLPDEEEKPLHEENLLRYIGRAAPHLKPWERQLIGMFCDRAQYFYPQARTQLMNEGFASFWHHTIMHDLHEEGLIDDSMLLEFKASHTSILTQPDFSAFNPYTLGFDIYQDIKRACLSPTDEDKKYFPEFAGNPDWLSVHKDAAYNYHDESFIYQFLSPAIARKHHMFSIRNDSDDPFVEVTACADEEGFSTIRSTLASAYDPSKRIPKIEPLFYDERNDRSLTLKHTIVDGKPLDQEKSQAVLKHIYSLWGHPVALASFDDNDIPQDICSVPKGVTTKALQAKPQP